MALCILIMGLPGSGKSTLASELRTLLQHAEWFNADQIRQQYNDWVFSHEGRIRQAHRMRNLSDCSTAKYVIADFVAPLPEMREIYCADFTVWVDTITAGRYADTNQVFVPPAVYNVRVTEKDAEKWALSIVDKIKKHPAS